jgi:hypothetical protein
MVGIAASIALAPFENLSDDPAQDVDVPAFLAAACAFAGDMDRAREYLRRFLEEVDQRITFGRVPEPGEPLRWLLHVNPFRRDEDASRLARGLRAAGLEADPDEERPEAVVGTIAPRTGSATFRLENGFWNVAFDGLAVQLTHQKGFKDLARRLQPAHRPHIVRAQPYA